MRRSLSLLTILVAILLLFQGAPVAGNTHASESDFKTAQFVSYKVVQHRLPPGSSQPWTITSDQAGNIWFVELASNQIGMYDPRTDRFFEYPIPTPNSAPQGISVDGDGNVWFAEVQASQLGLLPNGSSRIQEYSLPKGQFGLTCGPIGVTARAGVVWVTCEFSNQIDEFIPSSGSFLSFDLPVAYSAPLQTLFDSSGNFWFTAADAGMLGYATTSELKNGTTDGIQEFAPINQTYVTTITSSLQQFPIVSSLRVPSQIAFSSDGGSLWITEHATGSFDKYEIGSKTLVKYFTSRPQQSLYPGSLPNGIAVDDHGIVWFTEHYANSIGRFDPVSEQLTEYQIPCCNGSLATTLYLTLDRTGSVWFSEFNGDAIGELVPAPGTAGPSLSISPAAVAMGPDGEVAVMVSAALPAGARQTELDLGISGISPSGRISNLTADFSQKALSPPPGGNASSNLVLTGHGLGPGIYYLTLGSRAESYNISESLIFKLTVSGNIGGAQTTLEYGLTAVVAAAVVLVGVFAYRKARRPTRV